MKTKIGIINALWAISGLAVSFVENDVPFYFINLTVTVVLMSLIDEKKRYKRYLSICLIVMQILFLTTSILCTNTSIDIANILKAFSVFFVIISYFLLFPIKEKSESIN